MKKILITLLLACTLCFAMVGCGQTGGNPDCPNPQDHNNICVEKDAHIQPIQLGLKEVNFSVKIYDASTSSVKLYLDVEYQSRVEDNSVKNYLNMLSELFCLTLEKNGDEITGMKIISYATTPNTDSGMLSNNTTNVWNVYIDSAKKSMQEKVKNGDEVVFVYESVNQPASLTNADTAIANKYFFVKNNAVAFDFEMSFHAGNTVVMPNTKFIMYVSSTEAATLTFGTVIKAVCASKSIDYADNAGNICIGDYIGGTVGDQWHSWNIAGSDDSYTGSSGISDAYGIKFAAGTKYKLIYI